MIRKAHVLIWATVEMDDGESVVDLERTIKSDFIEFAASVPSSALRVHTMQVDCIGSPEDMREK